MTTVRIARAERRIPLGPVPDRFPTHVIVLADDAGGRDLPIWLLGRDSHRFESLFEPPDTPAEPIRSELVRTDPARTGPAHSADELTGRLLNAAGTRVTEVDIDELGPEVTVARIKLAGPTGTSNVMARLPDGLAVAITARAPIRVADAVMSRLAVPVSTGLPEQTARSLSAQPHPRYEPRNLSFADGLDWWFLGGSFMENAVESHWQDYACAAQDETGVLSSTAPQPSGFAFLGQEIYADDYRGAVVAFGGQLHSSDRAARAGLFLRVSRSPGISGPLTADAALADPDNHVVMASPGDWAGKVTAAIPDDANTLVFGMFLAGPGRIALRDADLTCGYPDRTQV